MASEQVFIENRVFTSLPDPTEQLFVTETVPTGSDNPASGRRLSIGAELPLPVRWLNLPRSLAEALQVEPHLDKVTLLMYSFWFSDSSLRFRCSNDRFDFFR